MRRRLRGQTRFDMYPTETSLLANRTNSAKSVWVKRDGTGLGMADVKRVQEATAYLITAPRHKRLVSEIRKAVAEHEENPRAFTGTMEPLNSLIELGLESPRGLERVLELIQTKRDLAHKLKRNDYQREFMEANRHRRYKAAELYELLKGPFPTKQDRNKHMNEAHRRWMRALDERLADAGPLSWWDRIEIKRTFWGEVDAKLEENLEEARAAAAAKAKKPRH